MRAAGDHFVARTVLPNCGIEVSRLGFGLARMHHVRVERDRRQLVDAAYGLGFTHFDTARMYGDGLGERALAPLLRGRRSAVTVATKFGLQGWDWMGAVGAFSYPARAARSVMVSHGLVRWPKHDYSAAAMVRSLDISLSLMNTDYVDILFVHEPPDASFVVSGALRDALLEAKTAGKVRLLGVAGKTAVEVYARHAGLFDVLQAPADRFTSGMALMPDITYGIMRAVRGSLLAQDDTLATAALRNAFRDRPAGSVIVATTNLEHLNEYVVAAWALTR